jgi:hypothetical protein
MKSWLGVIGRACLEFAIILLLLSFAAGASASVAMSSSGSLYTNAAEAALALAPLAGLLTLFLAFFSFELRIKSRAAGWIGLLFLGAMLFSFGIGIRSVPSIREAISPPKASGSVLRLMPSGVAVQQRRLALWIGSYEGAEAADAVAVDFGSDYPRLAYAARAPFDARSGDVEIQGRPYKVALPAERPISLVPEASLFAGSWIWDRLASMDDSPLALVFASAGGFLLLAIGFRFLCRISGWALANVFLAAAGLAGLAILDAVLSGSAPLAFIDSISRQAGISLPGSLLLACVEGILGLALGAIDVAAGPRGGRRLHE